MEQKTTTPPLDTIHRRGPHYIPPIVTSTGFNGTTKLRLVAMKISTDIGLAQKNLAI